MQVSINTEAPTVRPKREVTGYDTVWKSGVVHVFVPEKAKEGVFDHKEGVRLPFLQFGEKVGDGFVNLFVHTDDTSCRGKTIAAQATVMRKRLDDGSEFLHVDLKPCGAAPATHQLFIRRRGQCPNLPGKKIETPGPIKATILLTKLPQPAPMRTKPSVPERADPKKSLKELLASGWRIDSDKGTIVKLFRKGATGERETMEFRRDPREKPQVRHGARSKEERGRRQDHQ